MKKSLQEIVCNNLITLRTSLGFSQKELARKCGVTSSCICTLEKGVKLPSLPVLKKLSEHLNISIAEIVEEKLAGDRVLKSFYAKFKILEKINKIDQEIILNLCKRLKTERA